MQKKTKFLTFGLAGLLAFGTVGGIIAYSTDSETATNKFLVGDVSIEGLEPNYPGNDCDEVKNIIPNLEVNKDPQITNKGVNDAVVFMTVDSPIEAITIINDDGSKSAAKQPAELFCFKQADDSPATHANHFSDAWMELPERAMYIKIDAAGTETKIEAADLATAYAAKQPTDRIVKRYVFGHKTEVQGSSVNDGDAQTAANKVTDALFDKVQMKNVKENEVDEKVEHITVRYIAIQSNQILENSVDLGASLTKANLVKIYDIFVGQNSENGDKSGLKVETHREADSLEATSDGASGTSDEHVNRFDTTDDVQSVNCNLNPEACPVSKTPYSGILGTWQSVSADGSKKEYSINDDRTVTYTVYDETGNPVGEPVTDEYTYAAGTLTLGSLGLTMSVNDDFTELTVDNETFSHPFTPQYWYIFHSASGDLEAIEYTGEEEDITSHMPKNDSGSAFTYLYGGYYRAYGRYTVTEADKQAAVAASGMRANVTDRVYNPKENADHVGSWSLEAAYTESGMHMTPVADTVYYLKEVQSTYLWPSHVVTYQRYQKYLRDVICLTTSDDKNYRDIGFIKGTSYTGYDYWKDQITTTFGSNYDDTVQDGSVTVSLGDISDNEGGYVVAYRTFHLANEANKDYSAIANTSALYKTYWITPDNITVNGNRMRIITCKDRDNDGIIKTVPVEVDGNLKDEITSNDFSTAIKYVEQ